MPKLNMTADQIQSTENILKSTDMSSNTPVSTWPDNKYPSGQVLYKTYANLNNKITTLNNKVITLSTNVNKSIQSTEIIDMVYPEGSEYIASSFGYDDVNFNPITPAAKLGGGTWVLIDKEFKAQMNLTSAVNGWKAEKATLHSSDLFTSTVHWSGHSISIKLGLVPTVALSDTDVVLGKLQLANLGCGSLGGTLSTPLYGEVAISDGGQCTVAYSLKSDGTITVNDVMRITSDGVASHNMKAGTVIYINQVITFDDPFEMADRFCDKFYWQRTA